MFEKAKAVFMALFATYIVTLAFRFFFRVVFDPVPAENMQNANTILGFLLGSVVGVIIGYYFGASQSQSAMIKKDLGKPTLPKE